MNHVATFQPAELRRLGATFSFAKRGTLDPDHILHGRLTGSPDVPQERLKSRRPFEPASQKLLKGLSELGIRVAQGTNCRWSTEYSKARPYSVFSFLGPVLSSLEWTCPEQLGLSSIACGLALGVFIRPCTNRVLLFRRIASVAPQNKPQTKSTQRAPYMDTSRGGFFDGFE